MTKEVEGIMVSNFNVWKIWIGQADYVAYEGLPIEMKLQNRYLKVNVKKDYDDWVVEFNEDVAFNLRICEVYKVRVNPVNLLTEEDVL